MKSHCLGIFLFLFSVALCPFQVFAYGTGAINSTIKITNGTSGVPTIANNDFFGSVANIGDLDDDGVSDMAVGVSGDDTGGNRRGAVHLFYMNTDGTIKSGVKITGATTNGPVLAINDEYGWAVAGIGDLDNDSIPDIAVAARFDDTAIVDSGAVYIHYMNRDGSIKATVKIANGTTNGPILNNDVYGSSVNSIGDLDNDGIPDIAVGAWSDDTGGADRGAVYIHYMNRDGSIKSTIKIASGTSNGPILNNSFYYGSSVSSIGDLDNDGISDIAVGSYGSIEGTNRGTVFIHYMNRDGSIKSTVPITSLTPNGPAHIDGDWYGKSITGLGDLDNDDIPDIAVGAYFDDTGAVDRGAFYIHYMNRDGSIKSTVKITSLTANGPTFIGTGGGGARYGFSIINIGDLNTDGAIDIAVGSFNETAIQKGSVYIHFLTPTPGVSVSKSTLSTTEDGATDSFTIRLNSKPTNTVTIALGLTTSQVSLNTSTLTFTPSDWAIPQTVTVTAVDDIDIEEVQSDTITVTTTSDDTLYNALSISSVIARINDNDASRKSRVIGYYPTSVRTNISSEPSVIPAPVSPVIDTTPIPIEVPTLSFTKTLFMGVIDPQVQQLQVFLNTHGFPLALSGPGSSGQETTKFGSLTKNAVIKFQIANKITPAIGYVGPVTREVINKTLQEHAH